MRFQGGTSTGRKRPPKNSSMEPLTTQRFSSPATGVERTARRRIPARACPRPRGCDAHSRAAGRPPAVCVGQGLSASPGSVGSRVSRPAPQGTPPSLGQAQQTIEGPGVAPTASSSRHQKVAPRPSAAQAASSRSRRSQLMAREISLVPRPAGAAVPGWRCHRVPCLGSTNQADVAPEGSGQHAHCDHRAAGVRQVGAGTVPRARRHGRRSFGPGEAGRAARPCG